MTDALGAPDAEPTAHAKSAPTTVTPACRCRESRHTALPDTMCASTAPACALCGAHTAVLMPAVYIACFLSDSTMPGRVVHVRCGTCGLRRHVLAADVHEAGCASLLHAPEPVPPMPHAPAPDPLHIH